MIGGEIVLETKGFLTEKKEGNANDKIWWKGYMKVDRMNGRQEIKGVDIHISINETVRVKLPVRF